MYHILVVDDESIICESMKVRILACNIEGIGNIYEAHSGEEAFTYLKNHTIHVVFTDIKMPNMSGIELIHLANESGIQAKFVVLSGYDDYSYVREAFRLGAVDYLLKPASTSDIKEKIISIKKYIEEEETIKERVEIANNVSLHNQLKEYLTNTNRKNKSIKEGTLPYSCVTLAMIAGVDDRCYSDKAESINVECDKMKAEMSSVNQLEIHYFWMNQQTFLIFYNYENKACYEEIQSSIETVLVKLKELEVEETPYNPIWGVISQHIEVKSELMKHYEALKKSFRYKILVTPYELIKMQQNKRDRHILSSKEKHHLMEQKEEEQIRMLNQLILNTVTLPVVNEYDIDRIKQLYEFFMGYLNDMNARVLNNNEKVSESFESFHSLSAMRNYLLQEVYDLRTAYQRFVQRERTVSEIAKSYIKENYTKDIDMSVVANMVSMNYTYFSEVFKNETGTTFRNYIIKVRLEEAKRLLEDPTIKINEISQKIGYDNPKNFSRAFHNYTGVTPSNYREKYKNIHNKQTVTTENMKPYTK